MSWKLRLAHKGLILVGVPLLCQCVLFACLLPLLNQSEAMYKRAIHEKKVLAAGRELEADLLGGLATAGLAAYGNFTDPSLWKSFEDRLARMHHELKTFRNLTLDLPDTTKELDEDAALLDRTSKAFSQLDTLRKKGDIFALEKAAVGAYQLKGQFLENDQKKIQHLQDAIHSAGQLVESEPQAQAQLRRQAKLLVEAGLLASCVIALLLAYGFAQQISRRLKIMTDNNSRFLAGQALAPVVGGSDEITDLDKAFHSMIDELRSAQHQEQVFRDLRSLFISTATQDMQAPLASVSNYVTSLEEESSLPPETNRLCRLAQRNLVRMKQLVDDLSDLESLQSGAMPLSKEQFSISEAVHEAKELVFAAAEERKVTIDVSGDQQVFADKKRIVQVLTNLLANGVNYSEVGSSIRVNVTRAADVVQVQVSDHGQGIPSDMLEAIFKPFHQVHSDESLRHGGFGLGLTICKALVERHGGTISAQAQAGHGSSFCFTIPATDYRPAA